MNIQLRRRQRGFAKVLTASFDCIEVDLTDQEAQDLTNKLAKEGYTSTAPLLPSPLKDVED